MSREQILEVYGGERITKDKLEKAGRFITSMIERMNDLASGFCWAHTLDFDNANFPNLEEELGLPDPENFSVGSAWEDYKDNLYASATECASAITRDEMIRRYIAYFNIPAPDEYCTFDTPGMRDAWLAYENPP